MRAYRSLPEDYREILHVDLQKDEKTALKVSIIGTLVMLVVLIAGHFIVPISVLHGLEPLSRHLVRIFVLVAGYIVYMILHELTHAAVMKSVGGGTVDFGFVGMYAYAGSRVDYFDKIAYRCIALAPLIVWGVIFGVLAMLVPEDWFWVVWFLQAGNIGGAAGDVYVTLKLWNMPPSILVYDTGLEMTVFDHE